ncbi:MAG: ImmA/IrrE family metallo-endopeptidase [Clostridia bacterium]|nr:ImmA/IrrE family metallo-endopeptidase [Clostridia bacterium]
MNPDEIFLQADALVKHSGGRNTKAIAEMLGIRIYYRSDFKHLLGMYTYQWKHRMIFLNDRLDENLEQMVLAHEIGHDQRHRELAAQAGLQEFSLFSVNNSKIEHEANVFAAHLLLDSNEVYSCACRGFDIAQTASAMNTDVNLLLIKLQEMMKSGYDLQIPFEADSSFFGKIRK